MANTTAPEAKTFMVIFDREAPQMPSRYEELRPGHEDADIAHYYPKHMHKFFGVRLDTFAANGAVIKSEVVR